MKKALAAAAIVAAGAGAALIAAQPTPSTAEPTICQRVVACAMRIDPRSAGPTLAAKYAEHENAAECERTWAAMQTAKECQP